METLKAELCFETHDAETGDYGLTFPLKTSEDYWTLRRKYADDKSIDLYLVLKNPDNDMVIDYFPMPDLWIRDRSIGG